MVSDSLSCLLRFTFVFKLHVCVPVWECLYVSEGTSGGQRRASDSQELDSQAPNINGMELKPSIRTVWALKH